MRSFFFILGFSLIALSCAENKSSEHVVISDSNNLKVSEPVTSFPDTLINRDTGIVSGKDENTSADPAIAQIQAEYKRINSHALKQKEISFYCDADNKVTYFLLNNKVVKVIIDWGFVGDGKTKNEYYYKGDKLIFIFDTYLGHPPGQPDIRAEHRTYVENDRAIKYVRDSKTEECRTCSFTKESRPYKILSAYKSMDIKEAICK